MLVKCKILIIDAAESTRSFMRFILNNAGYRVTTVNSGVKAYREIEEDNFDVIVIDLRLPDVDGIELVREVRKISTFETIPILAVTQFFNTETQEEGAAAGITHWITQPVSPKKLLAIVDEISPAAETFDDEIVAQLIKDNS
ncbi:MAG: response regulator [Gammaproteobacteria bacterium]|nr:response regulator [Gammaproteobacteria bacterium]